MINRYFSVLVNYWLTLVKVQNAKKNSENIQAYSDIFRTLCNQVKFKTLVYPQPDAYSEPWYIQKPEIFRILAYSEPMVYSEP